MSWNLVNELSQHDQFMVSFCLIHTDSQQIQWRNPFDTFETLEKHIGTFTLPYFCGFRAQSN